MALLLKRKKAQGPAKSSIQGQPIKVFNSPTGTRRKGTSARNVERIKTLEYAMDKLRRQGRLETPEYESLKLEHTRRLLHFEQDRLADERGK